LLFSTKSFLEIIDFMEKYLEFEKTFFIKYPKIKKESMLIITNSLNNEKKIEPKLFAEAFEIQMKKKDFKISDLEVLRIILRSL